MLCIALLLLLLGSAARMKNRGMPCIALLLLLLGSAAARKNPTVTLEKISGRFVEKEECTFRCTHSGSTSGSYVLTMFLRGPLEPNGMFTAPSKTGHQKSLDFRIKMRRDYQGKTIACRSGDGAFAELKIGAVKKTIPTEVKFSVEEHIAARYVGITAYLHMCCVVSTTSSSVKVIVMEDTFMATDWLKQQKTDKNKFCMSPGFDIPNYLNGRAFACRAKSAEGEVYSEVSFLTIYDPTFALSAAPIRLHVFLDTPATASIIYNDLQPPLNSSRTFQVCKVNKAGGCPLGIIRVQNVTVKRLHCGKAAPKPGISLRPDNCTLNANITFTPQGLGRYRVAFVVGLHTRSENRTIRVTAEKLLLEPPLMRLLTPTVTAGTFGSLGIHLNVSATLQKEDLSVVGPSGEELQNTDFRVTKNIPSYATLQFLVCGSGNYGVALRSMQASHAISIQAQAPRLDNTTSTLETPLWEAAWISVEYFGSQAPAFAMRLFKVCEVDHRGAVIRDVRLVDAVVEPRSAGQFRVNISFVPEKSALFQVFHRCSPDAKGPRLEVKPLQKDPVLVRGNPWQYFAFFAVIFAWIVIAAQRIIGPSVVLQHLLKR